MGVREGHHDFLHEGNDHVNIQFKMKTKNLATISSEGLCPTHKKDKGACVAAKCRGWKVAHDILNDMAANTWVTWWHKPGFHNSHTANPHALTPWSDFEGCSTPKCDYQKCDGNDCTLDDNECLEARKKVTTIKDHEFFLDHCRTCGKDWISMPEIVKAKATKYQLQEDQKYHDLNKYHQDVWYGLTPRKKWLLKIVDHCEEDMGCKTENACTHVWVKGFGKSVLKQPFTYDCNKFSMREKTFKKIYIPAGTEVTPLRFREDMFGCPEAGQIFVECHGLTFRVESADLEVPSRRAYDWYAGGFKGKISVPLKIKPTRAESSRIAREEAERIARAEISDSDTTSDSYTTSCDLTSDDETSE